MSWLDWAIIVAYLAFMIFDGIRMTKHSKSVQGYFLANKSLPWWAVGLSVMATQLSAITLVGTTGQAYSDGMRFIQFYFGLPVAMIILCITVVKFFHNANVYTAYEYLEKRFDVRVRTLTSFFFLISRGLAAGVVIAAPSIILSIVLGWNLIYTIFAMGLSTTIYTMFGGVQAVTWTDVKQMVVIFFGLGVCLVIIVGNFPTGVGVGDGLQLAGAVGKLNTVDFKVDFTEQYTFWSGLIGGTFLALSYFGCDQSQVQRFLTAKSVDQGRTSLLMSAFLKIPMQFFILMIGIMVFVFYQFQAPPAIFNNIEATKAATSEEFKAIETKYGAAFENRKASAVEYLASDSPEARQKYIEANKGFNDARATAVDFVKKSDEKFNDVNYVFPTFVLSYMPIGVIGLIIAAIFAAAMSSISAELNALATATTIDFYRRLINPDATDKQYLLVGKISTLGWGVFACIVAIYSTNLGSLIEVVNKFGSFFYGSLLGVFALAFVFPRAKARGAFYGLLCGILSIALIHNFAEIADLIGSQSLIAQKGYFKIAFLWYNVVGCLVTVGAGLLISLTVSEVAKVENK
ncbi:MAG: sodium:solute symporter [Acidobacteria bacterium]|nr:sodium:solute symporter [Acidobacteriota bacterium]MBK8149938.1 sodium:solute symporter [Acidobacteriota bacterium]